MGGQLFTDLVGCDRKCTDLRHGYSPVFIGSCRQSTHLRPFLKEIWSVSVGYILFCDRIIGTSYHLALYDTAEICRHIRRNILQTNLSRTAIHVLCVAPSNQDRASSRCPSDGSVRDERCAN